MEKKSDIAAPRAINRILAKCVRVAKRKAPVKTSIYQGSIQMRPAQKMGNQWVGFWGSFQCFYALYIELGTKPHDIPNAFGWGIVAKHPGTKPNPVLRSTADEVYKELAYTIKEEMK